MPDLTVITPIAPHHLVTFGQCEASVRAQTVSVEHLYRIDDEGRGPGAVRNALLAQVTTPYVTFLDSDDWLEPTFAEQTLGFLRTRRDRYVFSDWYQDGEVIPAPDCPWTRRTFHLVTAVIPTAWVRQVGGFDETLTGMEDTDFYLKLVTQGMAGCRLPVPLVHYRKGGGRAKRIHDTGIVDRLQDEMARRYGSKRVGCCGEQSQPDTTPIGARREGDVLAIALWGGNRAVMGLATGRHYPRTGNYKQEWVDPRDVKAAPQMWAAVPEPVSAPAPLPASDGAPDYTTLRGLKALHVQLVRLGMVRDPARSPVSDVVKARPNVRKVKRLAGAEQFPIFVAPRRAYPSYADFWRLVDLGGFAVRHPDEIDLSDARQTYIFVTPEGIPDCTNAQARMIFWQLEYTGLYTDQPNRETCSEMWSSDPTHAAQTGARYVILGSHPGLNPGVARGEPQYDIAALAYLTPRREAIYRHSRLQGYVFAPPYPGHEGEARHEILSTSRLMLAVHQNEAAALAPIRLALAAAYHLPVVCEAVPQRGIYTRAVIWSTYSNLPEMVELYLEGRLEADGVGEQLYSLLCVEHRFDREVMQAVEAASERIAA